MASISDALEGSGVSASSLLGALASSGSSLSLSEEDKTQAWSSLVLLLAPLPPAASASGDEDVGGGLGDVLGAVGLRGVELARAADLAAAAGHALSSALSVALMEAQKGTAGCRKLRRAALKAACMLAKKLGNETNEEGLAGADVLAFFLPGVATLLAKQIMPPIGVGCSGDAESVATAVDMLAFVVGKTIGGEPANNSANDSTKLDASVDKLRALLLPQTNDAQAPRKTTTRKTAHEFVVSRTPEWVENARSRIAPVLAKSLLALCRTPDPPAPSHVARATAAVCLDCPWLLSSPATRDATVDAVLRRAHEDAAHAERALRNVHLPAVLLRHLVHLRADAAVHGDGATDMHARAAVAALAIAKVRMGSSRALLLTPAAAVASTEEEHRWLSRFPEGTLLSALLDACASAAVPDCAVVAAPLPTKATMVPEPLAPIAMRHITPRSLTAIHELLDTTATALDGSLLDAVDALRVAVHDAPADCADAIFVDVRSHHASLVRMTATLLRRAPKSPSLDAAWASLLALLVDDARFLAQQKVADHSTRQRISRLARRADASAARAALEAVGACALALGSRFHDDARFCTRTLAPLLSHAARDDEASTGARVAVSALCKSAGISAGRTDLLVMMHADYVVDALCASLREGESRARKLVRKGEYVDGAEQHGWMCNAPALFETCLGAFAAARTKAAKADDEEEEKVTVGPYVNSSLLPLLREPLTTAVAAVTSYGERRSWRISDRARFVGALRHVCDACTADANDVVQRASNCSPDEGQRLVQRVDAATELCTTAADACMHALGDNSVPPREARRELDVIVASMRGLLAAERGAAMLLRKDEQEGEEEQEARIPTLRPNILLPRVASAWAGVVATLDDGRSGVLDAGLDALVAICAACDSAFLARRFAEQAAPRLAFWLKYGRAAKAQEREAGGVIERARHRWLWADAEEDVDNDPPAARSTKARRAVMRTVRALCEDTRARLALNADSRQIILDALSCEGFSGPLSKEATETAHLVEETAAATTTS
ncbi:hypothetical protein PPROV_000371900 [Pycnococcus provasolii]|uniref:TTI1 N-terminal TPR domain-containing protein n=1 Tax=Pycnococcus provasolii TaxID=41880 RepID=A0A830HIT6_9CHLO|nr:hypothetical protein PPROV_000371900 [Pycnococcus provasolii]